jgi:hypothetical protein
MGPTLNTAVAQGGYLLTDWGIASAETEIGRGVRRNLISAEQTVRSAREGLRPDARKSLDAVRGLVVQAKRAAIAAAQARCDAGRDGLNAARKEVARLSGDHLLAHERQVTRALGAVTAELPRLLDGAARDVADRIAEVMRPERVGLETAEREIGRARTMAEAVDPAR